MKKILIISHAYYPHVGGAEVALREITSRIAPDGFSFDLITLRLDKNDKPEERIGNVRVYRIDGNKYTFQIKAAFKAYSLHKKNTYDALWALMAHSAGIPTLFAHWLTGLPYVLTLQEGDPPEAIARQMLPVYPLFVLAFRKAAIIQAISSFLGGWARDMGFKGSVEVIPNAVNTEHFSQTYSDDALKNLRSKLNMKSEHTYLITTSRLVHKNAIDDVIRALALLGKRIHFLVLGIGPDEAQLKILAKEKGVESRVHFLGQVDHSDMPKYLKVADIFIRPSRSEGMGISFIEAMAAGLPVIATQEGGIADFLFDAQKNPDEAPTGFAVAKDNPESIKRAVEYILHNPDEVRATIARAKQMAEEKYDWDLIAEEMKTRVFDRILD